MPASWAARRRGDRPLTPRLPALLGLLVLCACSSGHVPPAATPRADPSTGAALKAIAQRFNDDYQDGHFAAVWQRWDRASQSVISQSDYVRRHTECFTAPGAPARVETVSDSQAGYWLVRYEIGGMQFTDYWIYRDGRWEFDLIRSNPDAVSLYRLPVAAYDRAVGCQGKG